VDAFGRNINDTSAVRAVEQLAEPRFIQLDMLGAVGAGNLHLGMLEILLQADQGETLLRDFCESAEISN
jgi:hypothetical protein